MLVPNTLSPACGICTCTASGTPTDLLCSFRCFWQMVYTGVPRAAYFGIAEEARNVGIPFVGHVPLEIGVDEASNAGQRSVEHLMRILLYASSKSDELKADLMKGTTVNQLNNKLVDIYDPSRAAVLYGLFVKNSTWQVPTLTIRHARPYLQELQASNDPMATYNAT
jgi:hypothetical protein